MCQAGGEIFSGVRPSAREDPPDLRARDRKPGRANEPPSCANPENPDPAQRSGIRRFESAILILAWSDAADLSRPPLGAPASRRHAREARNNVDAGETPALPGRRVHRHNKNRWFRVAGYANRHVMCEETHPRRRDENPAKAGLYRSRGRRSRPRGCGGRRALPQRLGIEGHRLTSPIVGTKYGPDGATRPALFIHRS